MTEKRSFRNPARDEVRSLQRQFRRREALWQQREVAPALSVPIATGAPPPDQRAVGVAGPAGGEEPPPRAPLVGRGKPPPTMTHAVERLGFRIRELQPGAEAARILG